ncbi:hypothetical protein HDU98_007231 [Podochytrium sp. JEL0797]|nr:hypothetical protein HDU98_007231 [Podochytrium sp. JEL0797]
MPLILDGQEAGSIHGQDPQNLVEKIIRTRIHESVYWKEHCFALTAETIVDKAIDLHYIGGQFGMQKPTEFLCLTLRLLQLQPERSIIAVYLQNEDHKYLTALAAFYIRLTFKPVDCYNYLEPLLLDKRKLRMRDPQGNYYLSYMDEFADNLLRNDRVCEIILPRITKRSVLVEAKDLEDRVSPLEEDLDLMMQEEEEEAAAAAAAKEEEEEEEEDGKSGSEEGEQVEKLDVEMGERVGDVNEIKSGPVMNPGREEAMRRRELDAREKPVEDSGRRREEGVVSSRDRDRDRYDARDRDSYSGRSRDWSRDRDHRRRDSRERRPYYDRDDPREDRRRDLDRREDRGDSYRRGDDRSYRRDVDRSDRDEGRSRDVEGGRHSEERERKEEKDPFEPSTEDADAAKKKKKWSSKKVNALFKKSKDSSAVAETRTSDGGATGGGSRETMSIEETNKMRISLGLKPLKE